MSHEATHVATGAALSTMPTWLLEGFADYVALAHVDLPVSVTASQILGQVRKHGSARAPAREGASSTRRTSSSGRRTSRRGWPAGCSGSGTASAG